MITLGLATKQSITAAGSNPLSVNKKTKINVGLLSIQNCSIPNLIASYRYIAVYKVIMITVS